MIRVQATTAAKNPAVCAAVTIKFFQPCFIIETLMFSWGIFLTLHLFIWQKNECKALH